MRSRPAGAAGVVASLAVVAALSAPVVSMAASAPSLTHLGEAAGAAVTKLGLPVPLAAPVTRADAVVAVDAVAGLAPDTTASASYADVTSTASAFGAIEAAVSAGFMNGWAPTSGDFNPNGAISRVDLAILATNALGLQADVAALAHGASAYPGLGDLDRAGSDLGYVILMLKHGIVPPYDSTDYEPLRPVTVEALDVTLYRMWLALDVPVQATVTAQTLSPIANQGDPLGITVTNRLGTDVPLLNLSHYSVAFSLPSSDSASAAIAGSGAFSAASFGGFTDGATFTATSSGSYAISATLTGPFMQTPLIASATLDVGGVATVVTPPPTPAVTYALSTLGGGDYTAGNTTGITFTLTANGSPVGAGVNVTLTSTGGASDNGTFDISTSDGGSPQPSLTIPTDASGQVTVFLTDTTATDTGTVTATAEGVTASATLNVTGPGVTNVAATEVKGGIELTWTASGDPAVYTILEQVGGTGPFSPVSPKDVSKPSAVGGSSANVIGLTAGQTYAFEVVATDAYGNTATTIPSASVAFGASATATVVEPTPGIPALAALGTIAVNAVQIGTAATADVEIDGDKNGNVQGAVLLQPPGPSEVVTCALSPGGAPVSIGTAALNLVACLDQAGTGVVAIFDESGTTAVVTVTATAVGTEGNSYTLTPAVSDGSITATPFTGGVGPDTVTVNGETFTAVSSSPNDTEYDNATSLATAIGATSGTGCSASASGNVVTLLASVPGSVGNTITLATNDATDIILSGSTLTGGSDPVQASPGTVTITFSQAIDQTTLTQSNFATVLTPTGSFGTGASAVWTNPGTVLTITLGNSPSVNSGDTIAVTSSVTDVAGNPVATPIPVS